MCLKPRLFSQALTAHARLPADTWLSVHAGNSIGGLDWHFSARVFQLFRSPFNQMNQLDRLCHNAELDLNATINAEGSYNTGFFGFPPRKPRPAAAPIQIPFEFFPSSEECFHKLNPPGTDTARIKETNFYNILAQVVQPKDQPGQFSLLA